MNTPFAGLGKHLKDLPSSAPPPDAPREAPGKQPAAPRRAVVRYERKGHGGKEKTRVEQLGLPAKELDAWLRDAKRALGCGGVVDGDSLLLNGDLRERLPAWLEKRGVTKVSVS